MNLALIKPAIQLSRDAPLVPKAVSTLEFALPIILNRFVKWLILTKQVKPVFGTKITVEQSDALMPQARLVLMKDARIFCGFAEQMARLVSVPSSIAPI